MKKNATEIFAKINTFKFYFTNRFNQIVKPRFTTLQSSALNEFSLHY